MKLYNLLEPFRVLNLYRYDCFRHIQLPIYNEKFVVERLIDSVVKIEYPIDSLEIQILDDSTDETSEIIKTKPNPNHKYV